MRLIAIVIAIFSIAVCRPASAQVCTFNNTGINFGTIAASQNSNVQATGIVTANCTGTRGRTITICPNIGSGTGGNDASANTRYMTMGVEQISYNLYQNNGQGQIWGSYVWPYQPRPPAMSVTLGGSGTGTTQRTLYARMYQSVVSGGIYTSSFSGGHTLFDYGYSPQFRCSAAVSNRAVQVPFTVQVNNVGDCQITTTALDFGNVENLNATVDASNTIAVNCSNRVSYAISLDNGLSGSTNPAARIMKSQTSTDTVTYGIYTNAARSVPFGANAFTGRGDGTQRIFTAYGRIPAQATPTPSSYSDTIVVTVTY